MQYPGALPSAFAICLTFVTPHGAFAEERFTAILGVSKASEFYSGDNTDASFFPYLSYDRDNLHIGLDGLRYTIAPAQTLSFAIGLTPRFKPNYPDRDLFDGLERDSTLEASLSGVYQLGPGAQLSASFQHDLLSEHNGYEASIAVGQSVPVSLLLVGGQLGFRHRSSDLNDYLVGVAPSEATRERREYAPGSTTWPFAALSLTLPLGERAAVIGNASFDFFDDAYRDSPLVSKRLATSVSLGVAYKF